jgi:polyisoprenoid-binding protein YceI
MIKTNLLLAILAAFLGMVATGAAAVEPCTPFEDGRVDAELLATMREAAKEGRMYRVDAETSRVGFCVRHFPFQEFRGEFRNIVGGLALPPDPGQYGHALLLIHSASLISENSDLVPLVIGHSFIDAERYPEILFVGRRFVWLNDRQARIYGELTLRGRTQPVVFNVDVERTGDETSAVDRRIRVRGTTLVNRFQFDMSSYRYFVSEQVKLCLAVELVPWETD